MTIYNSDFKMCTVSVDTLPSPSFNLKLLAYSGGVGGERLEEILIVAKMALQLCHSDLSETGK